MHRIRIGLLSLSLLAVLASVPDATLHAQTPDQTAAIVTASTNDLVTVHTFIYGPTGGKPLKDLGADYQQNAATDPNAKWALTYQADPKQYIVTDLKTNQIVRIVPAYPDGNGSLPSLSPSTRYLTYSEPPEVGHGTTWILHIVDLSTNADRQFAGPVPTAVPQALPTCLLESQASAAGTIRKHALSLPSFCKETFCLT